MVNLSEIYVLLFYESELSDTIKKLTKYKMKYLIGILRKVINIVLIIL